MLGRDELLPKIKDPDYRSYWGLYDDSLFELVYSRFEELATQPEPFALVTLTLDTHHPAGDVSRSMAHIKYGEGENPMLNAVAASDKLLSQFIRRIRGHPEAADTVIVIASDHLAMRNAASQQLSQGPRRNLLLVLDPDGPKGVTSEEPGSTLDIAPTIFPYLGWQAEIGLGRDLGNPGLDRTELATIQDDNVIRGWREDLQKFWEFPTLRDRITVDIATRTVTLDDREFALPVLIEVDENWRCTPKFQFDRSRSHESLLDFVHTLEEEQKFILVDHGMNIQRLNPAVSKQGFAIVVGRGGLPHYSEEINGTLSLEKEQVSALLAQPTRFITRRIAHAGGEVDGQIYANSLESLNASYAKGYRYFEIDLSFTSDRQLVCIHDWE